MNVGVLRQHFRNIGAFADSVGSPKLSAQLAEVDEALAPFDGFGVAEFGKLLVNAERCIRDGAPFMFEQPPGRKPRGKAMAKPMVEPGEAITGILELYRGIATSGVPDAEIQSRLSPIDKFTKPSLQKLAEGMNIWHTVKKLTVPVIRDRIREEVKERRARFGRSDY